MSSHADLLLLLDEYAQSFPFTPIQEQLVDGLAQKLGGDFSSLLRHIYRRIGRGAYFMTIPFFDFDSELKQTLELRQRLGSMPGYRLTDRELVIGSAIDDHLPAEPALFFASDYSASDPDVYCISTQEDKILAVKSLSQVVVGLRGFPDCRHVPQELFDYYWYRQHFQIPADHNPVKLSIQIMEWKTAGRTGMDKRFIGHSIDGNEDNADTTSVFSPHYYL